MKTTVEIPDSLFREAKSAAAKRGVSLKTLFTDALARHLRGSAGAPPLQQPWKQAFGGLRDLHAETRRIERIIEREFGRIDEEEWR